VAVPVSREQVTALLGWRLHLRAKQPIVEDFVSLRELHTNSATVSRRQLPSTTSSVVTFATDVLARAIAGVDTRRFTQPIECLLVHQRCVALSERRIEAEIWLESEPGDILEQRSLVLRTATDAIVVFDAQQHAAADCTRDAPDVDRVDHMPEVKVARGRRRIARERRWAEGGRQAREIGTKQRIDNQGYVIPFLGPHDPFPPVDRALSDPNGLLAAGGDLSPDRLIDAYAHGIFPWFSDEDPVLWWSPDPRMVLFTSELHVSKSLRKRIRTGKIRVTFDSSFLQVMEGCAAPRPGQDGTWITDEMTEAYVRLFELGLAHSVETWEDDRLVGGLYGVALGRMFFGESMFSRAADASKVALATLVRQIERWGFTCIDCQMSTNHLSSLGAREIPRSAFLRQIKPLLRQAAVPSPWKLDADLLATIVSNGTASSSL
jgi:leucyl/phenylalanyl-tRNA---protein transferase